MVEELHELLTAPLPEHAEAFNHYFAQSEDLILRDSHGWKDFILRLEQGTSSGTEQRGPIVEYDLNRD